ncbi:arabinose 5-phosphate isomerase GutQ [Striga asiatica]|uniref:Arabinose 5-phosphate isomerase GutQ n=1 Tax=Striga asiatica TaxID=4170 RepID=A0A5A7RE50_STRAF|nr:arabinose 5-phosphate isomerase GutQ [Striga asiatica]
MREKLRQGENKVILGDFGDCRILAESVENRVDVEPEDGGEEEENDGFEVGLGENGPTAGPEGLAADWVHAGAETLHDGKSGDVGETDGEGTAGEFGFVHVAQEKHGDYGLGEVKHCGYKHTWPGLNCSRIRGIKECVSCVRGCMPTYKQPYQRP